MLLAWRNLTRDPVQFALSVAGVAVSMVLIVLLLGYRAGVYAQASAYLDHAPGDLVVAERGVADLFGTTSALSPAIVASVSTLPGVVSAVPIITQFVVFEQHGRKDGLFLVGYDPAKGGGPWRLASGRAPQSDDEIVLDGPTARQHAVGLGDRLRILDRDFTIVGLSDGTSFWAGSIAFGRLGGLETLLRLPGVRSFVLLTKAPTASVESLTAAVANLGVDLVPKSTLVANDRRLLGRVYDAPIGLMTAIAFIVGVLVVGLVIYAATTERRREYGALKAIGAPNGALYRTVVAQALMAAGLGAVVGVGAAVAAAQLLNAWRPQFLVEIDPSVLLVVTAASLTMATLAALAPARLLGRLEPAEILRA